MSPTAALLGSWSLEPSVVGGLAVLAVVYLYGVRRLGPGAKAKPSPAQAAAFAAGLITLAVALVSPLDLLADEYLFSAHMVQHLLLLVAPALLLLGAPDGLLAPLLRLPVIAMLERRLAHPLAALALYTAALAVWHVPTLYEWALASPPAHVAEHLCYLAVATLYWWPVVHPRLASARLGSLACIGYLFAACVPGTVIGAVLAFAPAPLYPTYAGANDPLGLFPLTRGAWGLTPLADQQLGGLLMWIPGGLVYLVGIGVVFVRWFATADDDEPLAAPAAERGR